METLRRIDQQDVIKPPEGFSSKLVWRLGQEPATRKIAEKLHFTPTDADLDFVLRATQRQPNTFPSLTQANGRRADFVASPQTLFETQYDTLEIGGYGYQDSISPPSRNGSLLVVLSNTIQPPSSENFALRHPFLGQTVVISEKGELILKNPFSFSGAYTRDQALKKVAANLFIVDKLADMEKPPFLVPVPIAIGVYPTVREVRGNPAYFIAWRVPYKGERSERVINFESREKLVLGLNIIANNAIVLGGVLRVFHDEFGLTHNQPHSGNFYMPDHDNPEIPPYLADFSTVYPIPRNREHEARSQDLRMVVIGALRVIQSSGFPLSDANKTRVAGLYNQVMEKYLGERPNDTPPFVERPIANAITASIQKAIKAGKLPRSIPTVQSWEKIQDLRRRLERATAA